MKINPRELRSQRDDLIKEATALVEKAEGEKRNLSSEEKKTFDEKIAKADELEQRAIRAESLGGLEASLASGKPPAQLRIGRGDSEARALGHFFRTGDKGGMRELAFSDQEGGKAIDGVEIILPRAGAGGEMRAVDSTMNITTAADGLNLVPTGFARDIVTRRTDSDLTPKLGVRNIPGKGTTVNYPYDNAEPVVFATTAEQSDAHDVPYQRDAAVVGLKAFTLVKKTKKVELTEELMDDEDVNVTAYVADLIGRGQALTRNTMLLTEVAANGTSLKTFAAAAAIAAGEPESIVFNSALGFYLDDATPGRWVMRNPTFGAIASITGNPRLYAETPGGAFAHEILGYEVFLSVAAAAIAASAKPVYFGNWFYVGFREDPALRLIRDPYSVDGLVILKYSFRAVYGVLQAGAIGYGVHPSA